MCYNFIAHIVTFFFVCRIVFFFKWTVKINSLGTTGRCWVGGKYYAFGARERTRHISREAGDVGEYREILKRRMVFCTQTEIANGGFMLWVNIYEYTPYARV